MQDVIVYIMYVACICMSVCICVCVCVCMNGGQGESETRFMITKQHYSDVFSGLRTFHKPLISI